MHERREEQSACGGGTDKDPSKSPPPLRSEKLSRGRQPADANYHQASSNATAKIQEASEPFQSSRGGGAEKGQKRGELEIFTIYQVLPLVSGTHFAFPQSQQPGRGIHRSELSLSTLPPSPKNRRKSRPSTAVEKYL